jgi:hypothetical protein
MITPCRPRLLPFGLLLLSGMGLLGPGRPLYAALDPELKKPYDLVVVLHVSNHPLLTDIFRDRLARELGDGLQAALGDLARVRVVQEHPHLAEVLDKGLQQALDGWRERSGIKTHFVLVDFASDNYELQARQHDGLTGLASPVVRRDRTRDRDFVARAAALLVAEDFGVVGTVQLPAEPAVVKIDLKGGKLGVPLGRWVKKGEVFALVQVPEGPGAGRWVPYAVLQVEEPPADTGDGSCTCRLFQPREAQLTAPPGSQGYLCLKLGTGRFPLRVRLVEAHPKQGTLTPIEESRTVQVRRHGFDGEEGTLIQGNSKDAGMFDTTDKGDKGLFSNVAFLTVEVGPKSRARVAIPLVTDRVEQIPLSVTKDGSDLLRVRTDGWARNVADSYLVQTNLFQEIKDLTGNANQRAQALDKARATLKRTREDVSQLNSERQELVRDIARLDPANRPNLAASEDRLKKLQDGARELEGFLAELEKINKEENDPRRQHLRAEVERANLLAKEAELGKAIEVLRPVAKELNTPELQQRLKEWEEAWKPRNEKHAEARKFIYEVWPTLDTKGVGDKLAETETAFKTCKEVGDLYGPKKLLDATIAHGGRMEKELGMLNEVNPDEEKKLKEIKELAGSLDKLVKEIDAYLRSGGK